MEVITVLVLLKGTFKLLLIILVFLQNFYLGY